MSYGGLDARKVAHASDGLCHPIATNETNAVLNFALADPTLAIPAFLPEQAPRESEAFSPGHAPGFLFRRLEGRGKH